MSRKKKSEPSEIMVVNDSPGEECRIAVLLDGHLEELYTERTAYATSVGNIYKGKVVNVEPAIQAAFIDFGRGQNGFLHISDLHPRYFPGNEKTERVGRKVPHRNRPPIQDALRRGDEVLVQVLKEGVGTKGPTLTSYLSIPGRLVVAMPYMDRVGVSRKIEDEDKRREMRKTLDQIELPSGFGFILRTAGFGRNKTELKRDVAYLTRLWKAMEKRLKKEPAPCELYTESDLLIRTIRDVLRSSIRAIIVDSESAYERASEFLRVAAPRSAPKLIRYHRAAPIFHAFDVERQIELIHCREVPLPSGGALVIEQTEAMVAIDVNSGRSRRARDSETNAFQTNCEAVDELCRQLRLRDLGGLIVNDLIDMRSHKNRRAIEERVRENLKRDRAKSTALRLSEFGLLEMTRQRMRPSLHKSDFVTCIHCNGHGEIKSPEYVAGDAVRQIGYLLQYDEVHKVEIVCSPRVASVLLSSKRREMVRLEDSMHKKIEVRVSDSIASDRVDFYAYDARGADISQSSLPELKMPKLDDLESEEQAARKDGEKQPPRAETRAKEAEQQEDRSDRKSRRSRRRGRGGRSRKDGEPKAESGSAAQRNGESSEQDERKDTKAAQDKKDSGDGQRKKGRRRGKRGGRKHRRKQEAVAEANESAASGSMRVHALAKEIGVTSKEIIDRAESVDEINLKSHMSTVPSDQAGVIRAWFDEQSDSDSDETPNQPKQDKSSGRKRRRRGGRRRDRSSDGESKSTPSDSTESSAEDAAPEVVVEPSSKKGKRRRTLYSRRTKVSPEARAKAVETSDT